MTSLPKKSSWILDFVLLAAIWGSSFMFMQVAAMELGAVSAAGMRVCVGFLFLFPILLLKGQGRALKDHWKSTCAIGTINSAVPFVCFTYAALSISTGLSSLLNATVPLFGAIVAWLWLKDRPNGTRIAGLLIGFVGVALLAWDKVTLQPNAAGNSSALAVLACLLACVCYGLAASASKVYLKGVPSLVSATGSQLGAAAVLLPLSLFVWPDHSVSLRAWAAVIALGVLCSGVAYILYFRIIERAGPAKALSVTFAIPVFAIFYGVTLLGETFTAHMALSGAVIVLGTALSTGLVHWKTKPNQ